MEVATIGRDYHDNNVYAHDVKNVIKHISEVISGRKGYYCMGCQREMQAKKGDIKSHHFAHDPKDVDSKGKCTYSDETYRHKLSKEVLQMIKQIKVPALYKYPPLGEEGTPVKIRDSSTIYAHSVEIELPFFEAEDGQVKWGRKGEFSESSNRYLLIQPDVAFFDADDKPVLLIEIVATHKVDIDKLSKIRRLGIDVVQITVPKDSQAEIQGAFYKTNRTKWLYSYEQETTAYVRIPQGNPEGIPPLDEFQRKLLKAAESFECRASQITGLLRAIGKSMGSEQYRIADQSVRDEIRRVERNTEGASAEVRVLQEKYRAAVADQFKPEEESVATATSGVEADKRAVRDRRVDLEARYHRKRKELASEQEAYRPGCQPEIDKLTRNLAEFGTGGGTLEERKAAIAEKATRMGLTFDEEQETIAGATRREQETIDRLRARREGLPDHYRKLEVKVESEFESDTARVRQQASASGNELLAKLERDRRESIKAIESESVEGASSICRRIREIIDAGGFLNAIEKEILSIRRMRKAKELLDSRDYKNWV